MWLKNEVRKVEPSTGVVSIQTVPLCCGIGPLVKAALIVRLLFSFKSTAKKPGPISIVLTRNVVTSECLKKTPRMEILALKNHLVQELHLNR